MNREISPTTIVRDIAVKWPELIPSLESLAIDYCCGGGRTLSEAAEALGLDPGSVAHRLSMEDAPGASREGGTDWSAASMTELADHIESTHHAFVRATLERLGVLLPKCIAAHGDDEPRLERLFGVVRSFTEDMHDHMVREERVLFPWLRRLERHTQIDTGPPWSVRRPIDCMVHDHDAAGAALRTMRDLTDGFRAPSGACPTWRAAYALLAELERDTHIHVHKENNVLFPKGVEAEEARKVCGSGRAPRAACGGTGGFTLVELLVVVSVVSVMIGVLLPALGQARDSRKPQFFQMCFEPMVPASAPGRAIVCEPVRR